MKKVYVCLLAAALLTDAESLKAQSQEEMKLWMEFMTPSDMHKMVASWDGEWKEEMTVWMDPAAPPQQMEASCVNKMIMGGRYQEARHTGNFGGMPFEGHALLAWDNALKKFQSTWIDNMGTGLTFMDGQWDAATRTIGFKGIMTDPMTGKPSTIRQDLRIVDENTQELTQYSQKDGKEFKSMFIRLTRKK